jgi:starch-binding outer membrane protein SusE/F
MKKISIIIFLIGLVGLFSCKKDETKAVLKTPTASNLTVAGGDSLALLKTNADSSITYHWTAANFGLSLVVTYTLQVDKQGNDFKDAVSLGTVTAKTSLTLLTSEFNNKLLTMEFNPDEPVAMDLEYRVQATVSNDVDPANSAAVKQVVSPYYVKIIYPVLFVPGNYQNWNPADSTTAIPSVKANDLYNGYLWMSSSAIEYKYTVGPTWTTNYGDDGADGTLDANGANIKPGAPGYYHLTVDLATKTHTFLRTDWGVIGDATPGGWDTDTDMAYDSIAKTWSVTLNLTAASIKFRANHLWDLNYGDTGANGSLEENGDNIAVSSAGNYTVTLNLSGAIFRYNLKKN